MVQFPAAVVVTTHSVDGGVTTVTSGHAGAHPDTNRIDWDALTKVEEASRQWRAESAYPLSDRYVPGEGSNPIAMIIGEAPGAQEDTQLRPFVGPAGKALRGLMGFADLHATHQEGPRIFKPNAWLTNVVKFRPPGNRKPFPSEVRLATPVLRLEWEAIGRPDVLIPVGNTALHALLRRQLAITKVSGKPMKAQVRWLSMSVTVWPMIHPSYALRNPPMQPVLERDWQRLGEWLDE